MRNIDLALKKLRNISDALNKAQPIGVEGMCFCILKFQIDDIIKDLEV